jgi:chemotaxis protein histidine kinase CheA
VFYPAKPICSDGVNCFSPATIGESDPSILLFLGQQRDINKLLMDKIGSLEKTMNELSGHVKLLEDRVEKQESYASEQEEEQREQEEEDEKSEEEVEEEEEEEVKEELREEEEQKDKKQKEEREEEFKRRSEQRPNKEYLAPCAHHFTRKEGCRYKGKCNFAHDMGNMFSREVTLEGEQRTIFHSHGGAPPQWAFALLYDPKTEDIDRDHVVVLRPYRGYFISQTETLIATIRGFGYERKDLFNLTQTYLGNNVFDKICEEEESLRE